MPAIGDEDAFRAEVDRGGLIQLGPPGEPHRMTWERVAKGYEVKSANGRQAYAVETWDEACAAALLIMDAK